MFIFCSLPSSSPSCRMSLSIAQVIFQEQSTYGCSTRQIAIEHNSQNRWHFVRRLSKTNNPVLDLAWCLLRLRPRGVVLMSNDGNITSGQIIPFWYGFYHNRSRARTSYTTQLHGRQLLMRNQSSWPPCTHRCKNVRKDMSAAFGQHHAFQTVDSQLCIATEVGFSG